MNVDQILHLKGIRQSQLYPQFLPKILQSNTLYITISALKAGLLGKILLTLLIKHTCLFLYNYDSFINFNLMSRSGLNMGFDFLLYQKGPQYNHAAYCVWIVRKDQVIQNRLLAGKVRVAASVKKVYFLFSLVIMRLTTRAMTNTFLYMDLESTLVFCRCSKNTPRFSRLSCRICSARVQDW